MAPFSKIPFESLKVANLSTNETTKECILWSCFFIKPRNFTSSSALSILSKTEINSGKGKTIPVFGGK